MKIRITRDTKNPHLEKVNGVYYNGVTTTGDGETVYFILHGGNYLGICAGDCEVIERESK